MALDRGAERLLRMLAASATEAGRRRTVAQRRAMLAGLAEHAGKGGPSTAVETSEIVLPGPGGRLCARLYAAPHASDAGLVYFHGGGWVAGGLDTHDSLCRRLASSSGVRLLAVDYRLAPEHPFPAAVEDALAATRGAAEQAAELGIDPRRLAVGGDSVGGGLAAVVAQASSAPPLALQLLICPILDLVGETTSRREYAQGYFLDLAAMAEDLRDYCGEDANLGDPRLSPLRAPALAGGPPALIHVAQYDPFRDESAAYVDKLEAAGVASRFTAWAGMIHYFYCLERAVGGTAGAVDEIGAQLAEALA